METTDFRHCIISARVPSTTREKSDKDCFWQETMLCKVKLKQAAAMVSAVCYHYRYSTCMLAQRMKRKTSGNESSIKCLMGQVLVVTICDNKFKHSLLRLHWKVE